MPKRKESEKVIKWPMEEMSGFVCLRTKDEFGGWIRSTRRFVRSNVCFSSNSIGPLFAQR